MIYSRFGSQVEVVAGNIETGEVSIQWLDGERLETFINQLKADDGFAEICTAIEVANQRAAAHEHRTLPA